MCAHWSVDLAEGKNVISRNYIPAYWWCFTNQAPPCFSHTSSLSLIWSMYFIYIRCYFQNIIWIQNIKTTSEQIRCVIFNCPTTRVMFHWSWHARSCDGLLRTRIILFIKGVCPSLLNMVQIIQIQYLWIIADVTRNYLIIQPSKYDVVYNVQHTLQ